MRSTRATDPHVSRPVDLLDLVRTIPQGKPVWAQQSADLNINLISIVSGQGIANHVNVEVDVLLIGIDGAGTVDIDEHRHPVGAGQVVLIPKGSARSMRCDDDHFAYLTCHRRRPGLMPGGAWRKDDSDRRDDP